MRRQFTRLRYTTIAERPHTRSIRLASATGILVVATLVAACGGGSAEDAGTDDEAGAGGSDNRSGAEHPDDTPGGEDSDDASGGEGSDNDAPDAVNAGFELHRFQDAVVVSTNESVSLNERTVSADTVELEGANEISEDVSYTHLAELGRPAILIEPKSPLTPGEYKVVVSDGVQLAGGAPAEPAVLPFTVEDDNAPDSPASKPPRFDEWKDNMSEYGHNIGQILGGDTSLSTVYYDGHRVFLQIAEFLGEREPWHTYAQRAEDRYNVYVDEHDGHITGYWRFTRGFLMDYRINGEQEARDYIVRLRDNPSFSDPTRDIADGWFKHIRSREVAYALQAQIDAEKAGEPRQHEKVDLLVQMALRHIESWTTGDYLVSDKDDQYVQAFMAGLTSTALIDYYERSVELGDPDERVLPAVREMADWLWREMWVDNVDGSGYGAFEYRATADGGSEPAGDLNMLIVPMYGWLYKETGKPRFLERGDQIFAGGVELAYLNRGKHFNQNYRDSFSYIEWRDEGVERHGS